MSSFAGRHATRRDRRPAGGAAGHALEAQGVRRSLRSARARRACERRLEQLVDLVLEFCVERSQLFLVARGGGVGRRGAAARAGGERQRRCAAGRGGKRGRHQVRADFDKLVNHGVVDDRLAACLQREVQGEAGTVAEKELKLDLEVGHTICSRHASVLNFGLRSLDLNTHVCNALPQFF